MFISQRFVSRKVAYFFIAAMNEEGQMETVLHVLWKTEALVISNLKFIKFLP